MRFFAHCCDYMCWLFEAAITGIVLMLGSIVCIFVIVVFTAVLILETALQKKT